jgi:hypothetical protein
MPRCRRLVGLATLLFMAAAARGQLAAHEVDASVTGEWRVEDVICPTCDTHPREEKGSLIRLTNTSLRNPFGGDCADPPGYNLLRRVATGTLLATKGKSWPEKLKSALRSDDSVIYGYITCDGGNHMRMIFTKRAVAYYFWEGDAVLVLKRKTP